jgi:two-component system CheB/CheR fusion protein
MSREEQGADEGQDGGRGRAAPDRTLPLEEMTDTLRAIREGEVDALVIGSEKEPRIFTLVEAHAALQRANDELEALVAVRLGELRQVNEALRAEIDVRARLEQDLRQKAEALEEADRRKDEFLSMLAHELRNPLAPILVAVESLRIVAQGAPRVERYRGVIERQSRNLARILDELLDVSRITRGMVALRKQPMELSVLVRDALEAAQPMISASRHTLAVDLPPAPVHLLVDPTRFEQALVNLLNNAAKYTEPGGKITLSATATEDGMVIRIRDTGMGMPAELLPRVFDLFVQGRRALDRAQGGLGIGLTMVKSLVEMHGGSVEAHSDGPGKGSEFVLRMPRFTGEAAPAPAVDKKSAQINPERRRVLVVEDNTDAAEMMTELLGLWGYEARAVGSGEAALQIVETFAPHAVLLDIGLPGMTGYELARRLRSLMGSAQPLLVGISGYGQEADRQLSREAGIDQHLLKPPDPHALRDILAAAGPRPPA